MVPERLQRFTAPVYPLLDGIGSVTLMDVMGDDRAVVQAARTSYGDDGADYSEAAMRRLIRYLIRNRHTTPLETGCEVKLHVKLPIFVERQWCRHRTAHWNEMSARYMELPDEFYVPDPAVRPMAQAADNKQGSDGAVDARVAAAFCEDLHNDTLDDFRRYQADNQRGLATEITRLRLGVNAYTVKVWKIDLHNLLHFLGLRLDSHAQWEIRQYALAIADIVKAWCPLVWEAIEDYRIGGHWLSRQEMELLKELIVAPGVPPKQWLKDKADQYDIGSGRERVAFWKALGLL
jgi:thymidylate synthase (FAD)